MSAASSSSAEFLPLSTLAKHLPHFANFPYDVRPTFRPLIEHLRRLAAGADIPLVDSFANLIAELNLLELRVSGGNTTKLDYYNAGALLNLLFPNHDHRDLPLGFVTAPFQPQFLLTTPELRAFLDEAVFEVRFGAGEAANLQQYTLMQAGNFILQQHYERSYPVPQYPLIHLRHRQTGFESYLKIHLNFSYLRVVPIGDLPPVNYAELLRHYDDRSFWVEQFPTDAFRFEGTIFGFLTDNTNSEIVRRLQKRLIAGRITEDAHLIPYIEQNMRSLLHDATLETGVYPVAVTTEQPNQSGNIGLLRRSGYPNLRTAIHQSNSLYAAVLHRNEAEVHESLDGNHSAETPQFALYQHGFRSLILYPLRNDQGRIIGIFELASRQPNQLHHLLLVRLAPLLELFATGFGRFVREMQDDITRLIQRHFTAIHPSVLWKFREVAERFYLDPRGGLADVVFEHLHPLYGQIDIVGSSTLRQEAIRMDCEKNLVALSYLLELCHRETHLPLLQAYHQRVQLMLRQIRTEFRSADEAEITTFLGSKVHPFLRFLYEKEQPEITEALDDYFTQIDAKANLIYEKQQRYNESVETLNRWLGNYLEREQTQLQKELPHYFTITKTDGVEYNIYLGQSILRKGQYSNHHLHNFRFWQLRAMCELCRRAAQRGDELPLPLETTALIFVYGTALSLRFRKDEKQFDVDGSLHVQYEILKKRVDKATLLHTNERLTQPGSLSIVYLHARDRQEYREYLRDLVDQGEIQAKIEELELEPLPGAEGLRAFRVRVR